MVGVPPKLDAGKTRCSKTAGEGPSSSGIWDKRDSTAAAELAKVFAESGLPATSVSDIEYWIWRKLAINAAINGMTALGGFQNGMIASDATLLDAAEVVAEEVASVARGKGIELGGMRRAILETAEATANNRSSMLQDLEARRRTEVHAIHGAVLAVGEETASRRPRFR